MDIEGQKLRDTFLWNKNESMLAPEQFAEVRTHFQGDRGGGVFIITLKLVTSLIERYTNSSKINTGK